MRFLLLLALTLVACAGVSAQSWNAPDRGAKVAALAPGRNIPPLTRESLFADWTRQRVDQWAKDHPGYDPAKEYPKFAAVAPADAELMADFPRHISPFAQVRSGKPEEYKAQGCLIDYCPFCGSRSFALTFDATSPWHANTNCCKTQLYGRDWPADYALKPTTTVKFHHLDDAEVEVPCTVYRDKDGVEWNLYVKTLFDHRRWLETGCSLVQQYAEKFGETGDPLYPYKVAVILDQVADTYYGLPLSNGNQICLGQSGNGLTRAEWESSPRPNIFTVGPLGPWNRRVPLGSVGWLNMFDEHLWVYPLAQVRHHPAFKYYSQVKYGDPEALDKKIQTKLLRELCMIYKSCFSQKLLDNYQEANYANMWLLGILAEDATLTDFAGPAQEVAMYNHSQQDGLNGEGAPNYMAMPGGYFYPYLRDPKGWLQFYPKFLEEHPFYVAADGEMRKLTTMRGMQVEFGDQHEYLQPALTLDPAAVRANEQIGSRNWAGYGVGIMRFGGAGHRQEMCLSYTRCSLHNAQDALALDCWFDGIPVMRRGGYAAYWHNAHLQWERPEYQALKQMDYPKEIAEAGQPPEKWGWDLCHSPACQNTLTVDAQGTGAGWGDNRGFGECITFKGGEAAGEPGSGFQVLDVVDHYSWSHVGKKMDEFRRTLIGIEGPDGRPYAVDILKAKGEGRQELYQSAFADAVDEQLPASKSGAETLSKLYYPDGNAPDCIENNGYQRIRKVSLLAAPEKPWTVTWKADLGAWGARDPNGKPYQRPWPGDIGAAKVRLIGLPQAQSQTELIRAKGPYIAMLAQALPGGQATHGNVAVMDGRDFVIERRLPDKQNQVSGQYIHILEGFREGEQSSIKSVTPLAAKSLKGEARDIVALQLAMTGGHTDTVIYQSAPGTVKLPNGIETDARYALLRQDAAGKVITSEVCRGTYVAAGQFSASMPGDFTGSIVDVIGDLTGTRLQSALIIKPDKPWPVGNNLKDRQLLIRFESDFRDPANEGWRLEKVTALPDGNVRVDVQDHAPFAVSWHQVTVLPEDKPNVIRTWRPMVDRSNNFWYDGMKLWFPARGKLYTIKNVNEVGGGYGGDTVELVEKVNLAHEGIKLGDWYVIYGVRPGLKVTVPNDFCFRQEPAKQWKQYGLRATGSVVVKSPALTAPISFRAGTAPWQQATATRADFPADPSGVGYSLVVDKPGWLNLNDDTAPAAVKITVDGREVTPEAAAKLGAIDLPKSVTLDVADADNPLDAASLQVKLDGKPVAAGLLTTVFGKDGKMVHLEVDVQGALAEASATARKHLLEVSVADSSVARRATIIPISFIKRMEQDKGAVYLSDLNPVSSFAHGALMRDTDYVGNPCQITGVAYGKCLTLCPEPSGDGPHGEVVYELPATIAKPTLLTDIGISDSSLGNGSATFQVQVGDSPKGPWRTLFTSEIMRGGGGPQTLKIPLEGAKYLRLWTTDAGDGIGSDHAVWGEARLKVGE
jgi:hypothetical protein